MLPRHEIGIVKAATRKEDRCRIIQTREERRLITGASSGIGDELTKLFAHDGFDLVLVARDSARRQDRERVRGNVSDQCKRLPSDLSEPTAANEIYYELKNRGIEVDILVNNIHVDES